jgi:hypothetical protein
MCLIVCVACRARRLARLPVQLLGDHVPRLLPRDPRLLLALLAARLHVRPALPARHLPGPQDRLLRRRRAADGAAAPAPPLHEHHPLLRRPARPPAPRGLPIFIQIILMHPSI